MLQYVVNYILHKLIPLNAKNFIYLFTDVGISMSY